MWRRPCAHAGGGSIYGPICRGRLWIGARPPACCERLDLRRMDAEVVAMPEASGWKETKNQWVRMLVERTGDGVEAWMRRIEREGINDEEALRAWLAERGVTGYAQTLLVWERFGPPGFALASAQELVDAQYADRPHLRPIYDAIAAAALGLGEVAIQARKTYVSLVTPRRTFARVQAATKSRVDLGLRLDGVQPGGRLRPSRIHESMKLQISFTDPAEVDADALEWLKRAYERNC